MPVAMVVAATLVGASAGLYYSTLLVAREAPAQPLHVSAFPMGCEAHALVVAAPSPLRLAHVAIRPDETVVGEYEITLAGRTATSAPWSGADLRGALAEGTLLTVWTQDGGGGFRVIERASGAPVAAFRMPDRAPDVTPPATTALPPPSFRGALPAVAGTVEDDCSPVEAVYVQVRDETTGLAWDGGAFAAPQEGLSIRAELDREGARSTTWRIDTSAIPWQEGHRYALLASGTDAAGNTGPSARAATGWPAAGAHVSP